MRKLVFICLVAFGISLTASAVRADDAAANTAPQKPQFEKWSPADDSAFLFGMREHNRASIKMARQVLEATKDEAVIQWAKNIIDAQQKQIDIMDAIIAKLGVKDEQGAAALMQADIDEMNADAHFPDIDINFVATMLLHHAAAIDISLPALVESSNAEIRTLARDIIIMQAGEVHAFRQWLDARNISF